MSGIFTKRVFWTMALVCTLLLFVFSIHTRSVSAAVIPRNKTGLDETLSDKENDEYAPAQAILLAQIPLPSGVRFGDSEQLYRGLYYYSIVHLGFVDIPFNYVVTWDGAVFEGKAGGQDVQPLVSEDIDEAFDDAVLIGYYGNNQEMTYVGKKALIALVGEIQSSAEVPDERVLPVFIALAEKTEETQPSKLALSESTDIVWNGIVGEVRAASTPISSSSGEISGSVEEVTYAKEVDADNNFVVSARFKNAGTTPWYPGGAHAVYLLASDPRGHESAFFVSDKWLSFTRVALLPKKWVKPGEEVMFTFEINAPLRPGDYSESFELLYSPDKWIDGTLFKVEFSVNKGDFDLVEILETETGYLNVRECPSAGCKDIGKVVPGEVYKKKNVENNWYLIQFGGGKEGWVYGKYVKDI